jgi:hypothetical protein
MEHDFYTLFSRFWWLIFPLFWMAAMVMAAWSRHARANRALDIVKSYADQGKDPPPELLKSLQGGDAGGWCGGGPGTWRYSPERRLHRTFLFGALAIAFAFLYFRPVGDDMHVHHHGGFLIPLVIFVALALSNLLSLLFQPPRFPPGPDGRTQ